MRLHLLPALVIFASAWSGCAHPTPPVVPSTSTASRETLDAELAAALEAAGVPWEGAAGRSSLIVDHLECTDGGPQSSCQNPQATGPRATAVIAALVHQGVQPTTGAARRYLLLRVACSRANPELTGAEPPPVRCDTTPPGGL